jgi:hypothetical protein
LGNATLSNRTELDFVCLASFVEGSSYIQSLRNTVR